ncbi:hypothetical protein Krac_8130 [Ktedonobacter racemifer DSM 44963]|uniref:Uncharacterized protein n=1 Tax=Ktedonobacter racemifer DSM 44963 TaxID=485913 RepID=D6TM14_KTERA|nr:hypothetical protein Krac_8130 [Ktedonobacter racemifer DSM 44963]
MGLFCWSGLNCSFGYCYNEAMKPAVLHYIRLSLPTALARHICLITIERYLLTAG